MYDYRTWTPEQRKAALDERRAFNYPCHSPPHLADPERFRIITGTCFEHRRVLNDRGRLEWFEHELLDHLTGQDLRIAAWAVLPNHYHVLVRIKDIKKFTKLQGQLHGRTSFEMNRKDEQRGRQVWYRCQDRVIRGDNHYFTTINYIHNNPVKHGYVDKWTDWPYTSFHWYLENKGREWMVDLWHDYPVLDYGAKWDHD